MTTYLATRGFNYKRNINHSIGGPVVMKLPVAGATGRIGDVLVWSSGKVLPASGSIGDAVGVALEDHTGAVAGDLKQVAIITHGQIWAVRASASTGTLVKGVKTVDVVTGQAYALDVADIVNGSIIFLEADPNDNTIAYILFDKPALY